MIAAAARSAFQMRALTPPALADVAAETTAVKMGRTEAAQSLAAALAYVAFLEPGAAIPVYETFAKCWLEETPDASRDIARTDETLTPEFWETFWTILDDGEAGALDPAKFTERVAGLGKFLPPGFRDKSEANARAHPLAAAPEQREPPRRLTLDELAQAPEGSLGHDIYRLIVDNRFDLEVLDRESIGLSQLPAALRFLNTRILQMHDVWHLVGGFRTTGLHEVAISAFQLAQFGHGYSAMLLATVVAAAALGERPGIDILLQTIAEAWRHGRNSPSYMAIDWEEEWQHPIADIRARHAIAPFAGSFPADLFEMMRG